MARDAFRDQDHYGYYTQQSTRPQTLGYGLADSPVAQAAWILEKYQSWTYHESSAPDLPLNKDEMLDTIMLYWLSNSATSSARYYWECHWYDATAWKIDIPVGVSWFPGDSTYGPKEWCERYYGDIVHWKEMERGGHFAAWEVPELFVREVREWRRKIG
jgi:pimeloyl-ACP methyl ester carboxylesterase